VASRTFVGVDPVQGPSLWIPAMMTPQVYREIGQRFMDRRAAWMHLFARLKPGLTPEDAEARLQPWFNAVVESESQLQGFPRVSAESRQQFLASTIAVEPAPRGLSDQRYQLRRPLWVLLSATALLLLLACLNVAGLLLARGAARSRELTTRVALGASRGQITSQLLVESTLVVLAGATLGVVMAPVTSRTLLSFFAQGLDVAFHFDVRIFAFTLLVCFAAAALCGLAPAWRARRNSLAAGIGDRSGSAAGGAVRLRKAIVIAQMSFTLILLIGAGLFVQTLARLRAKDLGFASSHLVMFGAAPTSVGYSESAAVAIVRDLVRRMEQLPGVERATVANASLLTGSGFRRALTIAGAERVVTDGTIPGLRVGPGFFATVGTRLVSGREFDERDVPKPGETSYRSIIVNESFARHYFGDRNPVGQHVGIGTQPTTPVDIEIIGVTRDVNYRTVRENLPEQFFLPFGAPGSLSADGTIFLKVRGEPTAVFGSIRAAVAEIDKRLAVTSLTTLDDQRDRMLRSERMLAILSSGFGTIALLLSMIGLYGIVSFVVTRRTREIGLRLAIGATPSSAVWLIVRGALTMVVAGMVIALPVSIVLGRLVETQLFGVGALHVPTIGAACLILGLVAVGAALIPAWRAASVNPMEALRLE
jgi:predicted permease